MTAFADQKEVEIATVCDVDDQRRREAASSVEKKTGKAPKTEKDFRRILDDSSIGAVIIATPDHWHGPAAILACDAGKHVYVEKPCCHNIREGRLMVEAARRNKRVVQTGTQSRSSPHVIKAMKLLHDGAIGDVLVAKAWNSQLRANIGHVPPEQPPAHVDYDTWVGPAPMVPYKANRFHSNWRWSFHFGTGDMGNDGVHDLDIARWGLGVETHPDRVSGMGGKYVFDDDQDFPDTMQVSFEYHLNGKRKQLVYEQRTWSPYVQEGYENGNAFYGTKGMMLLGKSAGYQLFGERNQVIEKVDAKLEPALHYRDFLACIRSGERPSADVEIGHVSAALAHLGNIATRFGRVLEFDPKTEQIAGDDEAAKLTRRAYGDDHWSVPRGV